MCIPFPGELSDLPRCAQDGTPGGWSNALGHPCSLSSHSPAAQATHALEPQSESKTPLFPLGDPSQIRREFPRRASVVQRSVLSICAPIKSLLILSLRTWAFDSIGPFLATLAWARHVLWPVEMVPCRCTLWTTAAGWPPRHSQPHVVDSKMAFPCFNSV